MLWLCLLCQCLSATQSMCLTYHAGKLSCLCKPLEEQQLLFTHREWLDPMFCVPERGAHAVECQRQELVRNGLRGCGAGTGNGAIGQELRVSFHTGAPGLLACLQASLCLQVAVVVYQSVCSLHLPWHCRSSAECFACCQGMWWVVSAQAAFSFASALAAWHLTAAHTCVLST